MAGSIKVAGHVVAEHNIAADRVDIKNATIDSSTILPAGVPVLLREENSISAVSQIDFTNSLINTNYKTYIFQIHRIIPSTDNASLRLGFSINGSSSFLTCYTGRVYSALNSSSSGSEQTGTSEGIQLGYDDLASTSGLGGKAEIKIFGSQDANCLKINCAGFFIGENHDNNQYCWWTGGYAEKGTSLIDFMRLKYDTGTIASYSYSLLGVK